MSLVTRVSVAFLVALALALGGFSACLYYLAGLRLLEDVADDVDVVIPGHGSVGRAGQVRARIEQDRAYVRALRDGEEAPPSLRRVPASFAADDLYVNPAAPP